MFANFLLGWECLFRPQLSALRKEFDPQAHNQHTICFVTYYHTTSITTYVCHHRPFVDNSTQLLQIASNLPPSPTMLRYSLFTIHSCAIRCYPVQIIIRNRIDHPLRSIQNLSLLQIVIASPFSLSLSLRPSINLCVTIETL